MNRVRRVRCAGIDIRIRLPTRCARDAASARTRCSAGPHPHVFVGDAGVHSYFRHEGHLYSRSAAGEQFADMQATGRPGEDRRLRDATAARTVPLGSSSVGVCSLYEPYVS